ncbi:MAG TPA: DUF1684 domain-containing protein [Panacibacter sp.]|nr:DUF1684 domain-containing protein [Panacibacter sp.]
MKNIFLFSCLVFVGFTTAAQQDSVALIKNILQFQDELNKEYKSPETSPLPKEKRAVFTQINFFAIDLQYSVTAMFTRTPDEKVFNMPTSGNEKKVYVKYAEAAFNLLGQDYTLNVYQSIELMQNRKYRKYLFIPFRDATSGKETYGGGRYIDLTIPDSDSVIIDFNKAYQPYCAYTEGYNCPIPPKENYLPVKVEAGVRL